MLICHHDYTSPASAVAVLRLQALADQGGAVAFRGMDALGLGVAIPPTLDLLAAYERHREALVDLGLEPNRPDVQPPTLDAHLVGALAEDAGLGASWRVAAYRAYWESGVDLGSRPALLDLAGRAGLDHARTASALDDRTRRASLRQAMAARRRAGVGGVPVLEVGGNLLGADLDDDDLRQLAGLG